MEELTAKEVKIYMNLPLKARQILRQKMDILYWVESEFGMGYKLEFPQIQKYYGFEKPTGPINMGNHINNMPVYTVNPTGAGTTSVVYNHSPWSSSSVVAPPTYIPNSHITFPSRLKIPYFADDIMIAARELVNNFFSSESSPPSGWVTFEMNELGRELKILLKDSEMVVKAGESDSYRTLALMALKEICEHLTHCYKPSLTDLKDVINISKNEKVKFITISTFDAANKISKNYPFCFFFEDIVTKTGNDDITLLKVDKKKLKGKTLGTLSLVEGDFELRYDKIPMSDLYYGESLAIGAISSP